MEKEIRLTSEMFLALLQGKKLQMAVGWKNPEITTIYPPHYGMYFTFEQIAEVKMMAMREGRSEILNLIDSYSNPKNKE